MDLKKEFRHVIDFPKDGIDFIDITPILQDPKLLTYAVDSLCDIATKYDFDLIISPESRGFILGTPMCYKMQKGFVPVRKKGKLPYKTIQIEYDLEYGSSILEMHEDSVKPGQKVILIDDLLATGGTTLANIKLVEQLGGIVEAVVCLVELTYLSGREKLKDYDVASVVCFDE
jgi:adenine phosphoribosyltransferase